MFSFRIYHVLVCVVVVCCLLLWFLFIKRMWTMSSTASRAGLASLMADARRSLACALCFFIVTRPLFCGSRSLRARAPMSFRCDVFCGVGWTPSGSACDGLGTPGDRGSSARRRGRKFLVSSAHSLCVGPASRTPLTPSSQPQTLPKLAWASAGVWACLTRASD